MPYDIFESNKFLNIMMIFHIISLLWNIAFAINFLDFLASGMMGFYYFKEDANTTECFW